MTTDPNKALVVDAGAPSGDFQVLSVSDYKKLREHARIGEESQDQIKALKAGLKHSIDCSGSAFSRVQNKLVPCF